MNKKEYKHRVAIQMRFSDVDGFGHVNNGVVQEYYDLGRMYYMRDVLGWLPGISKNDDQLVVVHTKTDFVNQILLGQPIEVWTNVYALGNKSLKMSQQIVDKTTETPLSICDSVMAGFRRSKGVSFRIPDEWRQAIISFEGEQIYETESKTTKH
jgi:acyl-CoA thioester hydrolase